MTKQELEMIRTTPVGGVFRYKGDNYEVRRGNMSCDVCAFGANFRCADLEAFRACERTERPDKRDVYFAKTTKPVSTPKRGLWKRIVEYLRNRYNNEVI